MLKKIQNLIGSNRSKTVITNMLISAAAKPLAMIIGFIYVPIVMRYLGDEKYGVWTTILSILSWISFFDIGIGNGLRNRLTEALSRKDIRKQKILVSSAYAFITLVSAAALVVLVVASLFLNWQRIFKVEFTDENLARVVIISGAFVILNFVLSICKNVLYALQKAAQVSIMELSSQLLNLIGILILTRSASGNLLLIAVIYGSALIVVSIVMSFVLYIRNPNLCPTPKNIDFAIGKELTTLGIQFFIIQICALILFTTDNLIISYIYGAADVTPYSTVNKLFGAIPQVFMVVLAPIWSSVTKAKTENDYGWLSKLMRKLLVLMVPFLFGTIVLTIFFEPIAKIWLRKELDYGLALIPLGACYAFLTIWCNSYSYVANGLEMMKFSMTVAIVQAVVNIPLSLLFAKVFNMQSSGVLLGTVLAMAISAVFTPIFVNKYIREQLRKGASK